MQARGVKQLPGQPAGSFVRTSHARTVRVSLQLPIAALLKFAIVPDGKMAGLERLHAVNRSPWCRDVPKLQERADAVRREARGNNPGSQKRFDLRGEDNSVRCQRVVERLNAKPVARQQQAILSCVPDRKRKHSAQSLDARIANLIVKLEHHFRIGARTKAASARNKPVAQLL